MGIPDCSTTERPDELIARTLEREEKLSILDVTHGSWDERWALLFAQKDAAPKLARELGRVLAEVAQLRKWGDDADVQERVAGALAGVHGRVLEYMCQEDCDDYFELARTAINVLRADDAWSSASKLIESQGGDIQQATKAAGALVDDKEEQ